VDRPHDYFFRNRAHTFLNPAPVVAKFVSATVYVRTPCVGGRTLHAGTRETAFVHAISAAGVAHAVTRACSSGLLDRCGCDRTIEDSRAADGFQWAGCSDNVAYGSAFSKSFVDARERRSRGRESARALMNLHNNNAGRKVSKCALYDRSVCHPGASRLTQYHPVAVRKKTKIHFSAQFFCFNVFPLFLFPFPYFSNPANLLIKSTLGRKHPRAGSKPAVPTTAKYFKVYD